MKRSEIITYSLLGLGFLVLIGLIIWAVSAFKKDNSEKSVDEAKKELKKSKIVPSYTEITFKSFAERLLIAMRGPGTTESTIFEIIEKLKNSTDWYSLVIAFGNPEERSLSAWLQDELSSTEMKRVTDYLKKFEVTI